MENVTNGHGLKGSVVLHEEGGVPVHRLRLADGPLRTPTSLPQLHKLYRQPQVSQNYSVLALPLLTPGSSYTLAAAPGLAEVQGLAATHARAQPSSP
jgi:hypothetical protein